MEGIVKSVDIKLNVQLVYVALIHEYAYEGPCRFGPPEALTKEFDQMNQAEIFKAWSKGIGGAFGNVPGINIMKPIYITMSDEFFVEENEVNKLTEHMQETDIYIFTGMRCEGFAKEFGMRFHVPVACEGMFASTILNAALSARGFESYAFLDVPDGIRLLRALRTRKALRNTRILATTRNNSQYSLGGQDALLSNDEAAKRLGVKFNYFSVHEFLDMMHENENSNNYTLPGRAVYNLTNADMVGVNEIVDAVMKDSLETDVKREYIVNSVKATVLAKKLMAHFQCNAFTAPCPDVCATRRMNQEQFTFCFTHSLLNEQGIPSACEYDLIGVLSIATLANIAGKAPYQGNTQPCVYHEGKVEGEFVGISYIPEMDKTPNIYYTGHATPNRLMHGFNEKASTYALRPFTHSGWGATMRIDFNQFKGEDITLMRFNPQCNKILVAKGTCIGGFGYNATGCSEGLYFEVADKYDYFHKQAEFGLHMPMVFGDHIADIKMLGKVLKMDVVIA
ncbi:MAG: FucI [Firmicutes bacterium]|nr:FucI [Bacillota bacterium]